MMQLCGTGWTTWSEFLDAADGCEGLWVDLSGPHLGRLPVSAPDTTHVWVWSEFLWGRARVDEGEVVAGFLHPPGRCPQGRTRCKDALLSEVRRAATWAEDHIHVGELRGREWEMLELVDGVATTFVRPAASAATG